MRRMAGQPKAAARGFAVNRLAYSELQAPLPATLKQAVPGPETGRMAARYGPFGGAVWQQREIGGVAAACGWPVCGHGQIADIHLHLTVLTRRFNTFLFYIY